MRAYINNKPFDFDQEITILKRQDKWDFILRFALLNRFAILRAHAPFASFVLNVQTVRN